MVVLMSLSSFTVIFVVFAVVRRGLRRLFCHRSSLSSSSSLLSVLRFLPTASIEWGPHISGPQLTQWSAVAVRKFSVRKLHIRRSTSPHFSGAQFYMPIKIYEVSILPTAG